MAENAETMVLPSFAADALALGVHWIDDTRQIDARLGRVTDFLKPSPLTHYPTKARRALNRQLKDPTGGALYFHNRKASPNWSKEYIGTVEVGEHIFYKPAGGKVK